MLDVLDVQPITDTTGKFHLHNYVRRKYNEHDLTGIARRAPSFTYFLLTREAIARKMPTQELFADHATNRTDVSCRTYGDTECVTFDHPRCLHDVPEIFQKRAGTHSIPEPSLYEISGAVLAGGPYPIPLSSAGEFLIDVPYRRYWLRDYINDCLREQGLSSTLSRLGTIGALEPTRSFDVVCSLVGLSSKNFGHWFQHYLPLLEVVDQYEQAQNVTLLIPPDPPSWMIESLSLLGFTESSLVTWTGETIRAETLLIPSPRYSYVNQATGLQAEKGCTAISPRAIRWLRDRTKADLDPELDADIERSDNVYISRRKADWRHIVNEDELRAVLEEYGYVSYCLEDLSIIDQVRLLSQSRNVVSPHGSGLTNIMYADDIGVLEIFGDTLGQHCYAIASALNFEYVCLQSESVETGDDLDNDIRIDPDRVRESIETYDLT